MTFENNQKKCEDNKMWCDDERDVVSMFLKYDNPPKEPKNLWKDVNDYLNDSKLKSKFDDVNYVKYEYEPLYCNDKISESSNEEVIESPDCSNEGLEITVKKNNFIYS